MWGPQSDLSGDSISKEAISEASSVAGRRLRRLLSYPSRRSVFGPRCYRRLRDNVLSDTRTRRFPSTVRSEFIVPSANSSSESGGRPEEKCEREYAMCRGVKRGQLIRVERKSGLLV